MAALASMVPQRQVLTLAVVLALSLTFGGVSQSFGQIGAGPTQHQWAEHYQGVFAAAGNSVIPTYSPHGMPVSATAAELQAQTAAGQTAMAGILDGSSESQTGLFADRSEMDQWVTIQRYNEHAFDFRAESVSMRRDSDDTNLLLTTDGVGTATPVLSTGDAPLNADEAGTRLTAAVYFANKFDLEFVYMGGLHWENSAQATSSTDSLFSVFSAFGTDPVPGIGQGFVATDQAALHGFEHESTLDSFELNFAQFRWGSFDGPVAGTWMFGIRYLRVNENIFHFTRANEHTDPVTGLLRGPGSLDYFSAIENNLIGFQVGGELSASPVPGMIVGAELKVGIYGNRVKNSTNIIVTPGVPSIINEQTVDETAAYAGELNISVAYRLFREVYARAGYQAIVVTNLGLGPNNFNTAAPFSAGTPRATFVDTSGQSLWQGVNLGVEWQF